MSVAAVWDLTVGLPSPLREEWPIVVLKAFVDDSGEGDDGLKDPVFVLAGFIADSTQWAAFCDEWNDALAAEPSIEYFRMSEAANLAADGQFAKRLGWNEAKRDEKVSKLAAIIPKHVLARISCTVDKAAFKKYVQSLPVVNRSSRSDKPYALAFQHIILGTAAVFLTYEIKASCDFIFDEHGKVGQEAVEMWDRLKAHCERLADAGGANFLAYMGQRPIFRNDKCFLPLQAADLYAWQVRRHFTRNRILWAPPTEVMRVLSSVGATMERHLGERELLDFRTYMERNSAPLLAANPEVELIPYKGTKAQQRRERVRKRKTRGFSGEQP